MASVTPSLSGNRVNLTYAFEWNFFHCEYLSLGGHACPI